MNLIVSRILGRASDLVQVEPAIALFLAATLIAVFLAALLPAKSTIENGGGSSLVWTLYRNFGRLTWALLLVALLTGTISVLRSYLQHSLANFQRTHGRITQANYDAVQTIWGAECMCRSELKGTFITTRKSPRRIESRRFIKPALLKKKLLVHVPSPATRLYLPAPK